MSNFEELPKIIPAFALGSLLCCAVAAQTVKTSHVPGTDFSKFHTYTWVSIKGGEHADPSIDAQIKQSIDSRLTAKGLVKVEVAADLGVDYQVGVTKVQKWQTYEDWSSAALLEGRIPQRKKITIDVGTLVLDMYDIANKNLVWTGSVEKSIQPNSSREDRQKNLDKAASSLLTGFPPK